MRLIYGDCFECFQPLKADITITDMPYGTTNCKWDSSVNLKEYWRMINTVSDGKSVCFAQSAFDKTLGSSNINNLRYEWIWEKSNASGHLNAKKCPMKAHENILVFGRVQYFPQMTHGHIRKTAKKTLCRTEVYGKQNADNLFYDSTDRYPRSVIRFPSDKQKSKLHPTQKPLALMEYIIKTYTKEGDTVFDPFMGSGTTGLACKNLNRNFIGIEKESNFFDIAIMRLK